MSLEEKQEKHRVDSIVKQVTLSATPDDLKAMQEIIDETNRMFSVDLDTYNKDLPMRLTLSEDIDPEPTMYPRTAALLRKLSEVLGAGGDRQITTLRVGLPDLPLLDVRGSHGDDVLGVMETILHGKTLNKGNLKPQKLNVLATDYPNVIGALDVMITNPELKNVLTNAELQWAYVQNIDTHVGANTSIKTRQLRELLNIDIMKKDYPSDLAANSQAYIAMMRSDVRLPTEAPVYIDNKTWESFLWDYSLTGTAINKTFKQKPKTLGEVLEFIFAYNVGKTFQFNDSKLISFGENRDMITGEVIVGKGKIEGEKEEVKGFKFLYKGIVAGTGPIRIPRAALERTNGSVSALGVDAVPGFFM